MGAAALWAVGGPARASAYPAKPVTIVVPFSAGGTTDIVARVTAEKLSAYLGAPFAVENRAGKGGNPGCESVALAAPDGYTLLVGTAGTHAINAALYMQLSFDPSTSFCPISLLVSVPNVLVVPAQSPHQSARDLVREMKAKKQGIAIGSAGIGTSLHLSGVLLNRMTGTEHRHVAYPGSLPMVADLLAGKFDAAFDNLPSALPLIRSGKLRALAIAAPKAAIQLPDVPTMEFALGLRNFDTSTWFALYAPSNTPPAVLDALSTAAMSSMKDRATKAQLVAAGCDVVGSDARQLEKHMQFERQKWAALVVASGAKLD